MSQGSLLWSPSPERVSASAMAKFATRVSQRHGVSIESYNDLYRWSIAHSPEFWREIWDVAPILRSVEPRAILENPVMPGARWFSGAQLNFAENLLRYRDQRVALIAWGEEREPRRLTYAELSDSVAGLAAWLRSVGVGQGDRVAAYIPNIPEAVIAMLASASIGAIWSSCSPDFGVGSAVDRLGQIAPTVLFTTDGYRYQGKRHDILGRAREIRAAIPAIKLVVVIPYIDSDRSLCAGETLWAETQLVGATHEFAQLPFDHPLYILYSSGTTGKPKCIVHGAGGTILQHYKELALHSDLRRDDVISYYTTCGWMMWNWLVSSLSCGAGVFLYDGSPAYPDLDILWSAIEKEKISIFGTSPKFLSACQKAGMCPRERFDLGSLRILLSTGSPLPPESFEWVYREVKTDLQLSSISGGTDIVSCFMLGNPLSPVYSGEIQARGLGMKVEVFGQDSEPLVDEEGELVCTAPFPSMPLGFWNDSDGAKYRAAYFERFPGVWRHGDFVTLTTGGGIVVHGRSDTTLNPGGVRIGAAEIYNPLATIPEIVDCVVVGQKFRGDIRIVLFVVLDAGLSLDDPLRARIRETIRVAATPRHLPAVILQVADIPRTRSGKKVELAVSQVINGQEVVNRDSLANPDSLAEFEILRGQIVDGYSGLSARP